MSPHGESESASGAGSNEALPDAHARPAEPDSEAQTRQRQRDEQLRNFLETSAEGIYLCHMEQPVPTSLSAEEQIERYYRYGVLAECNPAMAHMYGYERPVEMLGARLADLLVREDPANEQYLRAFIQSDYRLSDVESVERDRFGNTRYFENSLMGVVEDGRLLRAWGTQRDVTARRRAEAARDAEFRQKQRRFLREMLLSLTEGRLVLCDAPSELPDPLAQPILGPVPLSPETLRDLRHGIPTAAQEAGLPEERWQNLMLATGEAAMNAVVHAEGGMGTVTADPARGVVQVRVADTGSGIAQDTLHRATLERGFTTAGTLGHGFAIMLHMTDRIYLSTGPGGTTVILEQEREAAAPSLWGL